MFPGRTFSPIFNSLKKEDTCKSEEGQGNLEKTVVTVMRMFVSITFAPIRALLERRNQTCLLSQNIYP